MESAKEYLSGFRIPDLKKLWYGSSDAPDGPPPKPLIVQFEAYLVKLQELSLWTDPKSSGLALVVIHAIYWYLSVTSNSTVYLLAMLAMLTFVYTTWTQRIWPEIRVPEANPGPEPEWTPVSPDVLSAPELVRLCDEVKVKCGQAFEWLKQTRQNEHGKFCSIVSTFFLVLAYVGSRLTTLGLFYYVSVGYLTVPGILKILVKYPAVHCMLETMEEFRKEQTAPKVEVEPVVEEETKAASLAESVYATLQTGFNAVSNLNLKSEAAKHDEDLKSYLPEEDEANQSILESAINSSIKDPMQAHKLDQEEVADSSLEYASLLPVCGDLMPDDEDEDELDHGGLGDIDMQLQQQSHKGPEEDEEFLPSTEIVSSQSKALGRLEDDDEDEDDEFTASLMAAAAKDVAQVEQEEESSPSTTAIRHPRKVSPEMDDNLEDFEMISESELAEVSP